MKIPRVNFFTIFILTLTFVFLALAGNFGILPNFLILAQEENLGNTCQLEKIETACQQLEPAQCRQLLEKCEAYYGQESARIEADINKTQKEKQTLQNKINTLKSKIKNLDYQISQSNIIVKDLGLQVEDTQSSIDKTSVEIGATEEKLSSVLRSIYEEDQATLVEMIISEDLSDFFDNIVGLEEISARNKELLQNIKNLKLYLENQKQSLDEEKEDLRGQITIQTLQKQESDKLKKDQEYFLKLTEAEYQKRLKEKNDVEKTAQEIRSRIFELIGIPEAPTFGEAYEIAKFASAQTGVRPALLLAVLTQESNIGKNVGQCFLTNSETGEGAGAKTGNKISRVMSPSRDIPVFLEITRELGRDPYNTLVSCPMSYGWGGAIGPAQFIPSTWKIYKNRISQVTGRLADPWNIKDAFLAAALYLSDYGAKNQNNTSELNAVLSYFAGPGWSKSRYSYVYQRDYGNPVMRIASQYEEDIKQLQ